VHSYLPRKENDDAEVSWAAQVIHRTVPDGCRRETAFTAGAALPMSIKNLKSGILAPVEGVDIVLTFYLRFGSMVSTP
jgi:hypothetical protein